MVQPLRRLALLAAGLAAALATPAQAAQGAPAAHAAPARASTPNEQARFLAGLDVPADSPLAALAARPEWKDHVAELQKDWPTLGARLDKEGEWQATELAPRIKRDAKVIYLFGGPDAANVVRLFPDAPAYLLAGLEPVGSLQPPETMKPEEVQAALKALSFALRTTIPSSFFRTSEMGKDLQGRGIRGVLPVLYLFLARSGAEVLDSRRFEVDAAGVAHDRGPAEAYGAGVPGVRVTFRFPGRAAQELSYVRIDLGDEALAKTPGFFTWLGGWGPANGFLKAASFILHDNHFSKPRAFLLRTCGAILQEDSGIPFNRFGKAWDFTCFGKYTTPRKPFQRAYQADLDKACSEQPARPLPFVIGYRHAEDSNLLLAVKRPGASAADAMAAPGPAARPAAPKRKAGAEEKPAEKGDKADEAKPAAPVEAAAPTTTEAPSSTETEAPTTTPAATPTQPSSAP